MTRLRNILIVICMSVVLIAGICFDAFPTEWNMALAMVALGCVSGIWVITYAQRDEGQR